MLASMTDEPEMQGNGSPIYHHKAREREFEFAIGDSENIGAISDHIEKHIGKIRPLRHHPQLD